MLLVHFFLLFLDLSASGAPGMLCCIRAIPCHTVPYRAMLCHTMPYYAIPCHTVPWIQQHPRTCSCFTLTNTPPFQAICLCFNEARKKDTARKCLPPHGPHVSFHSIDRLGPTHKAKYVKGRARSSTHSCREILHLPNVHLLIHSICQHVYSSFPWLSTSLMLTVLIS